MTQSEEIGLTGTFIPVRIRDGEMALVDTRDGAMWGFSDGEWALVCPPPRRQREGHDPHVKERISTPLEDVGPDDWTAFFRKDKRAAIDAEEGGEDAK